MNRFIIPWSRSGNGNTHFMDTFQKEFDQFFENFSSRAPLFDYDQPAMPMPRLNLKEDKEHYYLEVELAGVKPDDVSLNLQDNTLFLKAERKLSKKSEEKDIHRMESFYGTLQRNIRFDSKVDPEKVSAKFENGVLEIELKKSKETLEKTRQIPIKC